jgi:NADPH2:quinone reductase
MALAVVATGYGGPENLSVVDVEVPDPVAGQVRVEVRASGVNPIDHKLYGGGYGQDPARLPMRLGFEVAGVVTGVGGDAQGPAGAVRAGDEVIAYPIDGGYAEAVTVAASSVLPKPAELSFEQAAGLSLTGVTAYHLVEATGVRAGDTVLVHAASGGVGLIAAQLGVEREATVLGTASARHHDRLRGYGVVPVEYGDGLADRVRDLAPGGVDVALDTVGTDEAVDVSLALVADRRRIATIAAFGRAPEAGIQLLGNGPGADPGEDIRSRGRLVLSDLVRRGRLRVEVARTFALTEAAEAHRLVASGHAGGKVVLLP